jgi:hypothetical protein
VCRNIGNNSGIQDFHPVEIGILQKLTVTPERGNQVMECRLPIIFCGVEIVDDFRHAIDFVMDKTIQEDRIFPFHSENGRDSAFKRQETADRLPNLMGGFSGRTERTSV